MGFVFSPSNISAYKFCPRRFAGQSIYKTIKYKPSAQKSRGMVIHEQVQDAMRGKLEPLDALRNDMTIDVPYTVERIHSVLLPVSKGARLGIEYEMTMTKAGASVGWWDDKAFLRAKADAVVFPANGEMIRLIDIKTGRNYGDTMQLRIECLLAHILYKQPVVRYEYWYVDQGETVEGQCDFSGGLTCVKDIYDLMAEMGQAIKNNDFPPAKNQFCRWCDFYQKPDCGL